MTRRGMTTHRSCLDALTEAMALPRIVAVPDQTPPGDATRGSGFTAAQGPSRHTRQQGRIQDYGRRVG